MYTFSKEKNSLFSRRGGTFFIGTVFTVMAFLLMLSGGCKKSSVASYSKFRVQTLDYTGIAYVNSAKLSNGNYITADQEASLLHFNIGGYDTKLNKLFLKKYTFTTPRAISCCIPFGAGFMIAGFNDDNAGVFVAMFDASGNAVWDSTYTPAGKNKIHCVSCCAGKDGNILLVGSQKYPSSGKTTVGPPFIIRIDPTGKVVSGTIVVNGLDSATNYWATSVYERNDGIYMSGFYFFQSDNDWQQGSLMCMKAKVNGDLQWLYTSPVPSGGVYTSNEPYVNAYNIAETDNGPLVLTGITTGQFSSASVYYFNNYWYPMIGSTLCYSFDPSTGKKNDSAIFGINNKTTYPIIHPANDGGFIVATTCDNFLNSFTVPTMVTLIKTDAHFNIQWQRMFNPNGANYMALGVFPLKDGYEIVGQSNSIVDNKPTVGTFLMETDLSGNLKD